MDKENKNVDKKSLAYFAGQAMAFVFGFCVSAIFVALCCKLLLWMFPV